MVAPLASFWVTGSSVLSVILTCLGIVWYTIQISAWVARKRATWTVTKTTTVTRTEAVAQAQTPAEPPKKV